LELLLAVLRRKKQQGEPQKYGSVEMELYTIENVKILEQIGSGEFGNVYRGQMDVSLDIRLFC
jgi:hypothetical protein